MLTLGVMDLFLGNIKMSTFRIISLNLGTEMEHGPIYPAESVPWLLTIWWCIETKGEHFLRNFVLTQPQWINCTWYKIDLHLYLVQNCPEAHYFMSFRLVVFQINLLNPAKMWRWWRRGITTRRRRCPWMRCWRWGGTWACMMWKDNEYYRYGSES